jgi:hypothetical protein
MARILLADAQAWAEGTKMSLGALDAALLAQVESQVVAELDSSFDVTTWVNDTNTPAIVKSVIAMLYVSWVYDRQYSEDQEQGNDYAALLRGQAASLISGLKDGSIIIPGQSPDTGPSDTPVFFPTDASSALPATPLQPELGPASFHMGVIF